MSKADFLLHTERLIEERFTNRLCAFIGGSHFAGNQTQDSDVDLWLIFPDDDMQPQRISIAYNGIPFEIFVHSVETIGSFLYYDRKIGVPANCHGVCHSIIFGPDLVLADRIRRTGQKIFADGPEPLTSEEIDDRRYQITGAIKALKPSKSNMVHPIVADLYLRLADFHLRANQKWSGRSKYMLQKLNEYYPELHKKYHIAFSDAFRGKPQKLIMLIDEILEPFGGRLFDGYQRFVIKLPKTDHAAA